MVTAEYNTNLVKYLDYVGKIHTPKSGSAKLDIPLVQMNALMGFVSDAQLNTILGLGLDQDAETRTIRAFNKLLWIQNDLISRHYQASGMAVVSPVSVERWDSMSRTDAGRCLEHGDPS